MIHYLCIGRQVLATFLISVLFTLMPLIGNDNRAFAAEETNVHALIEGAKKEGEVVFYSATNIEDTRALVAKFNEKYPSIKVEIYSSINVNILNRMLMEAKGKRRINDVLMTAGVTTQTIKDSGLLARYLSPESKFYPEGFKDKEGYWTDSFLTVHSMVYNTRLLPARELPVKYRDLLNPKWKGKMGINLENHMWILAITDSMGEQEGLEFLKALAQQNPVVRTGGAMTVMLAAAGEISLGVSVNANSVERAKAVGAPVDWIRLKEPFYGELHPVALNVTAPHPNAAKLLIDYILSPEGQEVLVKLGRISSRTGLKPSYIKADLIRPLNPTPGKTEYTKKLIRQIFVK